MQIITLLVVISVTLNGDISDSTTESCPISKENIWKDHFTVKEYKTFTKFK